MLCLMISWSLWLSPHLPVGFASASRNVQAGPFNCEVLVSAFCTLSAFQQRTLCKLEKMKIKNKHMTVLT